MAESPRPTGFPCPQCGKPSRWTDNPYRPFCCERCKLIDLGGWASEDYRIPLGRGNDFNPEPASAEED
ncbi:hypothetical protein EV700_0404 [Fluviicoccus keumensis]|uniref:DNA gyrase inhibitor YacG n=1 Tax=Fluviicoccus keumensis TaxID=1435465 RepID=A0A4Q7ZA39_9GAMM|nr:DNA gyrase inhibitor YacG [Fluviicoccus keumensis]RZU47442.1 hypothetical protein EV700_0404 [Fluviicoccus keumensis]